MASKESERAPTGAAMLTLTDMTTPATVVLHVMRKS
jgi:hypothetical protein